MTTFVETDDAAFGATSLYALAPGQSLAGEITVGDFGDTATAALVAGQTYTFGLIASGGFGNYTLSYDNGAEFGEITNFINLGNLPTTTSITFTALTTGTYSINVQGPTSLQYRLSFEGDPLPVAPTGPSEGDDILIGASNSDNLDLLGGNDSLAAGGGSDRIRGGAGNDTILGESGNDRLEGGADNDALYGGSGRDSLFGDTGDDLLDGGNDDDLLDGGDGTDLLLGGAGNDLLTGGAGDDILDGGSGDDMLTGGAGADTFVFRSDPGRDTITDFTTGTDRIDLRGYGIWDVADLVISDSSGKTRVSLGNGAYVELLGVDATSLTAADFILDDAPPPPVATGGADTLTGTAANDVIDAGGGSDVVRGGGGNDLILGGAGEDQLYGDAGRDTIEGGSGADRLFGGAGNDIIYGDASNDLIYGGSGSDFLHGGADNDRLYGDGGNDTLIGESGNDKLFGGNGLDLLEGGAGKDTLDGGGGRDTLAGGLGEDLMTGGAGADIFVFEDRMNHDRVTDFQDGLDLLDVSGWGFLDLSALTITQIGTATEIRVNAGNSVTLDNVDAALIDSSDFIFAFDPGDLVVG